MAVMHWRIGPSLPTTTLETFSTKALNLSWNSTISAPAAGIMPVFRVSGMMPVVGCRRTCSEAAGCRSVVACHDVIRSVGAAVSGVTVMVGAAVGVTVGAFVVTGAVVPCVPNTVPSTSVDS